MSDFHGPMEENGLDPWWRKLLDDLHQLGGLARATPIAFGFAPFGCLFGAMEKAGVGWFRTLAFPTLRLLDTSSVASGPIIVRVVRFQSLLLGERSMDRTYDKSLRAWTKSGSPFCELFSDGIRARQMWLPKLGHGKNALFDLSHADVVNCTLHRVEGIEFEFLTPANTSTCSRTIRRFRDRDHPLWRQSSSSQIHVSKHR
jgi:hypothetical protein